MSNLPQRTPRTPRSRTAAEVLASVRTRVTRLRADATGLTVDPAALEANLDLVLSELGELGLARARREPSRVAEYTATIEESSGALLEILRGVAPIGPVTSEEIAAINRTGGPMDEASDHFLKILGACRMIEGGGE